MQGTPTASATPSEDVNFKQIDRNSASNERLSFLLQLSLLTNVFIAADVDVC